MWFRPRACVLFGLSTDPQSLQPRRWHLRPLPFRYVVFSIRHQARGMALVNVRIAWNAYEARARLPRLDGKRDHAMIRRLGTGGHFSVSGTRHLHSCSSNYPNNAFAQRCISTTVSHLHRSLWTGSVFRAPPSQSLTMAPATGRTRNTLPVQRSFSPIQHITFPTVTDVCLPSGTRVLPFLMYLHDWHTPEPLGMVSMGRSHVYSCARMETSV